MLDLSKILIIVVLTSTALATDFAVLKGNSACVNGKVVRYVSSCVKTPKDGGKLNESKLAKTLADWKNGLPGSLTGSFFVDDIDFSKSACKNQQKFILRNLQPNETHSILKSNGISTHSITSSETCEGPSELEGSYSCKDLSFEINFSAKSNKVTGTNQEGEPFEIKKLNLESLTKEEREEAKKIERESAAEMKNYIPVWLEDGSERGLILVNKDRLEESLLIGDGSAKPLQCTRK